MGRRERKQRKQHAVVGDGGSMAEEGEEEPERPFQEELAISGGCWAVIVYVLGKDQTQGAIIFAAGSVAYFMATYVRPGNKSGRRGFMGVNLAAGWAPIVVAPIVFCSVFVALGLAFYYVRLQARSLRSH